MLLFVHLAGCLCLSLAYSIYTFSAPPHPSRRLISNPVCPARRNPGFYFVLFFFFGRQQLQAGLARTARSSSAATQTHVQTHTHTRRERERDRDGGWQRHAACAYILLFIFYFILYYAFCAFRLSLSCCLQFRPSVLFTHSQLPGGEAGQAVGLEF